MTDSQWRDLLRVIQGEAVSPTPVGAIVDSPWLPKWAGVDTLDYFGDDQTWLRTNLAAVRRFERVSLLPGFWAEFGMYTEPSAFGSKGVWPANSFPSAEKIFCDYNEIGRLKKPNCKVDGLLPFVIRRLQRLRPEIEAAGHRIRFATSRGPLNIASYLLGQTEFLLGLKTNAEDMERLLDVVTDFIVEWIDWQATAIDSIDGIFLLDDLIGFLGQADFERFVTPYFKRIYESRPAAVKFLHNDAAGMITARNLAEMGANMYNFSFKHGLREMREAAGPKVVLVGNVPPRDVLAAGTADDVRRYVAEMLDDFGDRRGLVISCGGGVSPGTPAENLDALCGWE